MTGWSTNFAKCRWRNKEVLLGAMQKKPLSIDLSGQGLEIVSAGRGFLPIIEQTKLQQRFVLEGTVSIKYLKGTSCHNT